MKIKVQIKGMAFKRISDALALVVIEKLDPKAYRLFDGHSGNLWLYDIFGDEKEAELEVFSTESIDEFRFIQVELNNSKYWIHLR